MKEEIPKCNSCGQPMVEVGGIGKTEQLEEMREYTIEGTDMKQSQWYQTGQREQKLYQCPECKDVKIY